MSLLLFSLSACVSSQQYLRLQQRVEKMDARIDKMVAEIRELKADLQPLIDRKILTVEVVDGRVTLGMRSDVLFASGSAQLSETGKANIAELTRALSRRANDHDFQVEGHTDSEDIHTEQFPDNWHLGAARALNVAAFMRQAGFPEEHLSASTFADTQPAASNNTPEGRAQNRRIEIVVLPDLSDLPGYKRIMEENKGRARGRKGR
jgi:chemotaxis protein MotB